MAVLIVDLPERVSGFTCLVKKQGNLADLPVIVVNKKCSLERRRLTFAHELCHRLIDPQYLSKKDEEYAANRFVGAFLMPFSHLEKEVGSSSVLSPNYTAHQAYQKAIDTWILLASTQTLAEYENVMLRSKFDRYVSLARRQTFLAELRGGVEQIQIIEFITDCRDAKDNIYLDVAVKHPTRSGYKSGDHTKILMLPYLRKNAILMIVYQY